MRSGKMTNLRHKRQFKVNLSYTFHCFFSKVILWTFAYLMHQSLMLVVWK